MSRPLLTGGLDEIQERVQNAPFLSLYLDFDGTLTPIVDRPAQATLSARMRTLLCDLSHRPDVLVAVVSGRALSDLRARIGIDGLVYAGNHGLEIEGRGLHFTESFGAARQELLERVCAALREGLRGIPGVEVEYKGLTASVHYRRAFPESYGEIERIVRDVVASEGLPFRLNAGNMVWEIVPRTDWHKGAAVCWIQSRLAGEGAVCIYIGDDETDETAFRNLQNEVTICVGESRSSAACYRVSNPDDVFEFLMWLGKHR